MAAWRASRGEHTTRWTTPADVATSSLSNGFVQRAGYRRMEYSLFANWRTWVDARAFYSQVKVPITLVYGDDDWSTPADRAGTAAALHVASPITLPATGHFASLE